MANLETVPVSGISLFHFRIDRLQSDGESQRQHDPESGPTEGEPAPLRRQTALVELEKRAFEPLHRSVTQLLLGTADIEWLCLDGLADHAAANALGANAHAGVLTARQGHMDLLQIGNKLTSRDTSNFCTNAA